MTNILLSLPSLYFDAHKITTTHAATGIYSASNLLQGYRSTYFERASTSDDMDFVFQFGTGVTYGVDHIIIGRADLLQSNNATELRVANSTNMTLWSTGLLDSNFDSATLSGRDSQDYIADMILLNRLYWRVRFSFGAASTCKFSKLYLGRYFDMEREPSSLRLRYQDESRDYEGINNTRLIQATTYSKLAEWSIEWRNIPQAKAQAFMSQVGVHVGSRPFGAYLYASDDARLFQGVSLVHVNITSAEVIADYADKHTIRIVAEEME